MKASCQLTFEYPSKKQAEQVHASTKIDDGVFVDASVQDNIITATINSDSLPSLMHTLDDYLSCVSVAEKIVNKN